MWQVWGWLSRDLLEKYLQLLQSVSMLVCGFLLSQASALSTGPPYSSVQFTDSYSNQSTGASFNAWPLPCLVCHGVWVMCQGCIHVQCHVSSWSLVPYCPPLPHLPRPPPPPPFQLRSATTCCVCACDAVVKCTPVTILKLFCSHQLTLWSLTPIL